ncbi:hypothetical protein G3T14_16640 [Methylobacterium sp. BTF04]|uniref:hypothetical protein n=1 Tax=Methylobacterium sp. BTF04 TaxID=2708300 RepID=UPI0013D5D686|nr:hypothetical protein [Methylobacterium sp. BTF04]NEU13748.1 hypothetical protein [Methylobacterium sp. BTF04]
MNPIVIGIVAGLVVAGGVEAYKVLQEISKETDAWKACLKLCEYCALTRRDMVTYKGPVDNDYVVTINRLESSSKGMSGTNINRKTTLKFIDHWYKSNQIFASEDTQTDSTFIYGGFTEHSPGSVYTSDFVQVDPKELRAKLAAEFNVLASRTAKRSTRAA